MEVILRSWEVTNDDILIQTGTAVSETRRCFISNQLANNLLLNKDINKYKITTSSEFEFILISINYTENEKYFLQAIIFDNLEDEFIYCSNKLIQFFTNTVRVNILPISVMLNKVILQANNQETSNFPGIGRKFNLEIYFHQY